MCRGWNPSIERRDRDAEITGHIAGRHSAGEQLFRGLDLAIGHLAFATALAAELASDFESGASAFDGKLPFHFGEAGHYVKEEAPGGCSGVDCIGEALELHVLLVKLADQINQMLHAAA